MFREIIRREVRRQKLSGYRIGKLADMPARTIQSYLAGTRDLTGERLAQVCRVLGLELQPKRPRTKKSG
ncbi:MAG: helix-turn-helix domain-containing protein [Planctomycetes bacterium]|nr:helix-turn-helix domain-containing protein [Planctomycetota bacterium]